MAFGMVSGVRAGTVLVAVEVETPKWRQPCPSASILLGELRRRGLPAQLVRAITPGVAASRSANDSGEDHPVVVVEPGAAELLLAAAGAVSPIAFLGHVDLGQAGLGHADLGIGTPFPRGMPASLLAALKAWGRATGPRRILLAEPRSFCAGVERAIEIVERAIDLYGSPLYVRKQIVHNVHVVRELEQRGAVFVDELDEVPPRSAVVFSAHGVSPAVRAQARERGLRVIDATCPLVTKVHSEAKRFARRGDTIVLIGHSGHEESEGTLGEAPERTVLVQSEEEVRELDIDGPVSYLMQTTLSVDEAEQVVTALRTRFPHLTGPSSNDICYATTNRQNALREIAAEADVVLVVGSANSSNSVRLVEVAEHNGTKAHLVDDVEDVDPAWLTGARTVGVTAGASAPPRLVTEIISALRAFGPIEVCERRAADETVRFGLPKEVVLAGETPALNAR
ncbi:4-hydroxy-3-methylbut-2-enyl diphosphate reductase [Lentzea flava]|uniref:4-hydroxy-3-methylbut-2-enyl diphosphate reductase n=1 Tax=Lentzea flava TaxID=103732 RepID=UPI001E5D2434|nr:4-hydroxy-3-methylbut-2-enyl diphosphate reductase [Lentzea flava]